MQRVQKIKLLAGYYPLPLFLSQTHSQSHINFWPEYYLEILLFSHTMKLSVDPETVF